MFAVIRMLATVWAVLFTCQLSAQTMLLQSSFSGKSPALNSPWTQAHVVDSSLSYLGWTHGPAMQAESNDDAYVVRPASGADDTTLADANAAGHYLSCRIAIPQGAPPLDARGWQINLTMRRLSYWSPRTFAVFSSADGWTVPVYISGDFSNDNYAPVALNFFLPRDAAHTALGGELVLRIVPFKVRYNHPVALEGFSIVSGIATHSLSVMSGPGGIATSSPQTAVFEPGTSVSLTATPAAGHRFVGWSGDLSGKGNPRTMILDADRSVTALFEPLPVPSLRIGTNLENVTDWTTAWVFKDVLRRQRSWMTHNLDGSGAFDSGFATSLPLDADGWPTQIPFAPASGTPSQYVHTIVVSANAAGPHTLVYEGRGNFRIRVTGQGWIYPQTDGARRTLPLVLSRHAQIELHILGTDVPPNHLRGMRLVPDEWLGDYDTAPFHPLFVEKLRGHSILRFMDWGRTNGSPWQSWANRTLTNHYTQARAEGVALELMTELCNTAGADLWYCVPHAADDDAIARTAALLRDSLASSRKVYVEYSNETWNTIFSQTTYVQNQGQALTLDPDRWAAGQKFAALRSTQVWAIFEQAFSGQTDRLVKVLASQSANLTITRTRYAAINASATNPAAIYPDVLAIAPYFGQNFSTSNIPPTAAAYPTADQIVDNFAPGLIAGLSSTLDAQKQIADTQGARLVCYEGGQHFLATGGAENDQTLLGVLAEANRHPRMYRRYQEYLDLLRASGVDEYVNFTLAGSWGRSGTWGVLEAIDQAPSLAVKHAAVADWIEENILGGVVFRITRFTPQANGTWDVEWRAKPDRTYRVQSSQDLSIWSPVSASLPSGGLSNVFTLPAPPMTPPAGRVFYRVVED